ncbi:Ohr family peroxiredoxin [Actinomadura syzygii]|uniref:Ohr family peroxiredoxin n=1 Tax=Actinomadura syzygii TaxID=1427538 RepID=UPI001CA327FB|nr:Ohr family peroxiredoxin [Actinomadura syzygii]
MDDPPPTTSHDNGGAAVAPIYTARVTVTGGDSAHGRATGRALSSDGALDLALRTPKELGGDASGPNPEQLFAAGFAASLHGVLALLARQHALDPAPITVDAAVALGRAPAGDGYELRADLVVRWPGVARETAAVLVAKAAELCPYSRMARRGIPVTITLAAEK